MGAEVGRVHCDARGAMAKQVWLKAIFSAMQADRWSPNGEARGLMMRRKLTHTSMSVGDAVQIGGELYVAGIAGFMRIKEATALLPPGSFDDEPELDDREDDSEASEHIVDQSSKS